MSLHEINEMSLTELRELLKARRGVKKVWLTPELKLVNSGLRFPDNDGFWWDDVKKLVTPKTTRIYITADYYAVNEYRSIVSKLYRGFHENKEVTEGYFFVVENEFSPRHRERAYLASSEILRDLSYSIMGRNLRAFLKKYGVEDNRKFTQQEEK
jgi:hypothetical protein